MVKEKILFKDISILALVAFFVQLSRTACAILVEGIMRNISVKLNLDQWLRMCPSEIFLFLNAVNSPTMLHRKLDQY